MPPTSCSAGTLGGPWTRSSGSGVSCALRTGSKTGFQIPTLGSVHSELAGLLGIAHRMLDRHVAWLRATIVAA